MRDAMDRQTWQIRSERKADAAERAAISEVVRSAFKDAPHSDGREHLLG
jgi:hypothetical protein